MKKYALFVVVGLLLALVPFVNTASVSAFSGAGDGTPENPYVITNATQLQEMNDDLYGYYVLGNDIDASETSTWDLGEGNYGFTPIGNRSDPFEGILVGQGYIISNLYMNRELPVCYYLGYNNTHGGMFGKSIGIIFNIELINCSITFYIPETGGSSVSSATWIGSLVGQGTAECCYANGTLEVYIPNATSAISTDVGGLIGTGTAEKCGADVDVNFVSDRELCGYDTLGGLVGVGASYDSYSRGNINTTLYNGMGSTYYIGGLIGWEGGGTIENSYSTGTITLLVCPNGTPDYGGLVGNYYEESVYDSFWDTEASGIASSPAGTGKTTAQMKMQSTFTNWSFEDIWSISSTVNDGYPYISCSGIGGGWPGPDYVPKNLLAIPISSTEIALTWNLGVNTTASRIMGKTGGWPSSYDDPSATLVYEGSGTSTTNEGLTPGTTYYYRAWGELNGTYSEDYAEDLATTFMGGGGGDVAPSPMPPWWFQNPSCAAYNQTPIFGLMQTLFASYDLPDCTGCLLVTIFLLILGGIFAYAATHNTLTSGLVLAVLIVIMSIAGLLPMWMLLVVLIMVIGITFAWSRA